MGKPMWLTAVMLVVLLVTQACQSSGASDLGGENEARTYYESLNLETPEDAVQTFTNAFQREDFMTVYMVLDAETQRLLRVEFATTFSWGHLIGEDTNQGVGDHLDIETIIETQWDFWYLFDQIMLLAAKEDDLLIDLRGEIEVLRTEDAGMILGAQAMDVIASVDGVSGEVTFRMVMDNDSRWRVYMVSAPTEGVDSWPSTVLNESP
ncbi:MAG: hypothetical protein GTO18_09400 [Anaerolineales bacterium]|nr:hypothetical protein [Anaerolineales bacterium]